MLALFNICELQFWICTNSILRHALTAKKPNITSRKLPAIRYNIHLRDGPGVFDDLYEPTVMTSGHAAISDQVQIQPSILPQLYSGRITQQVTTKQQQQKTTTTRKR